MVFSALPSSTLPSTVHALLQDLGLPEVYDSLIHLVQGGTLLLKYVPPVLTQAEPSDEDQHLPLVSNGDICKGEGCIHLLELVHIMMIGLEGGPLPQTIKLELNSDFMVKGHVTGLEGLLDLIPVIREGTLVLGIQVGLDIRTHVV
jgi:hypothetical protein